MAWFVDVHTRASSRASSSTSSQRARVPVVPAFLWAVASGLMPHRDGLSGLRIDEQDCHPPPAEPLPTR